MEAARALSELLELERAAALRADVSLLLELQAQKRSVMDALRSEGLPPELRGDIETKAAKNLVLLRHLVRTLKGILGDESVYGPLGRPEGNPALRATLGRG